MNETSDIIQKEIIKLYNDGYGVMKLSKKYKIHRSTVQKILKKNGIQLRKRTPIHYNVHFFDEYNETSCYWAGFISADGYVRSDRAAVTIHLAITDYEHLLKLAQLTDYEGKVNINNNECYITFAGKWFQEALADKFDIYPRKTFNIEISEKIPKDMLSHFIRGYFDGDGCITTSKSNNCLHISFTSGSDKILYQIRQYFYDCGIRVRNKSGMPKKYNRAIIYNCSNAFKILKILYENSLDKNRLNRKYKLYVSEKEKYEHKGEE